MKCAILAVGAFLALAPPCLAQEIATSDPALICGKVNGMSYSRQHRKLLLEDERQADFARWHVPWREHRDYELDHIIPLCLGGGDTPANRRPQRCEQWKGTRCIRGPAFEKDSEEIAICLSVCDPRINVSSDIVEKAIKEQQVHFAAWKEGYP